MGLQCGNPCNPPQPRSSRCPSAPGLPASRSASAGCGRHCGFHARQYPQGFLRFPHRFPPPVSGLARNAAARDLVLKQGTQRPALHWPAGFRLWVRPPVLQGRVHDRFPQQPLFCGGCVSAWALPWLRREDPRRFLKPAPTRRLSVHLLPPFQRPGVQAVP